MMHVNRLCPSKQHTLKFSKEAITISCWPQQIFDLIMWETLTFSNLDQPVTVQKIKMQYAGTVCILTTHIPCLQVITCSSCWAHRTSDWGTCALNYALGPIYTPGHKAEESFFCPYWGSQHLGSGIRLCHKNNHRTHPFETFCLNSWYV